MKQLPPDWVTALRRAADAPPLRPRVPLRAGGAVIGSVKPDLFIRAALSSSLARETDAGWDVGGDVTRTLHDIALALRDAGLAHAWRDEQLAVRDASGRMLGTVERGVVRPLGIPTHAVHLLGLDADGHQWVQRRALTKASDPGLWDTLMGGMVPACDTVEDALARETWEEAGLRLDQLLRLERGGSVVIRRPTGNGAGGYVVETIDWYSCEVPATARPNNQDGEVDEFARVSADRVREMLVGGEFTLEAALVLLASGL